MKFDWKWLFIAIIIFAALVLGSGAFGKWLFVIVMAGVALYFGAKILPKSGIPK